MGEIQIGEFNCIQRPIKVDGLKLDKDEKGKELYVNSNGEKLTKIQIQKSEYEWLNDTTGQKEDKPKGAGRWPYKSFNGKPAKAFKMTKAVVNYDTIDINDRNDFIENEKTYQLISDGLKAKLKELHENNQTIAFKYVNSGFKVHRAVLELWNDRILMRCFRGDLKKIDLDETIETDEIQANDDGVEQLDLDAVEA